MSGIASFLESPTMPLVVVLAKATLLIAVGAMISQLWLRSRASAALRHLVWTIVVVSLLLLPVVTWAVPGWRIAVATLPARSAALPALAVRPSNDDGETTGSTAPAGTNTRPLRVAPSPPAREATALSAVHITDLLAAVYLAGVCVLLLRIGAGHWSLRRLVRRAIVVDDPESIRLVRELSAMLALRRSVRLLRDRTDSVPMTWGTCRPTILLPASSADWSPDRRRVVLLHELAHVARLDCVTQLLGSITCALYWFHPGVWYVAARLRAEGELACDDRVLVAGAHPRSYAAHLLEVAHRISSSGEAPDVAVAMARPSQLEERMSAALDGGRSRRGTSRQMVLAAGLAAGAFVAPVASVRPVAAYIIESRSASAAAAGNLSAAAVASRLPGVIRLVDSGQVIERLIATRRGGRLVLDLATGADVKVTGWDRDSVFAHAELRGRDWRSTRVEMLAMPAGARIVMRDTSERWDYSTSHQLTIRVPRRYDVQIESMGGGIAIAQVQGTFAGRTNGGELRLTALAGDVQLHTNGGGITVTDSHLDGDVRTNGGNVEFRNVSGSLRGHTNGGRITRVTGSTSDQMEAARRSVVAADEKGFAFVTGEDQSRRRAVAMLAQQAPPAAAIAALERLTRQDGDPGVRAEAARQLNDLRRKMGANVQDSSSERLPEELYTRAIAPTDADASLAAMPDAAAIRRLRAGRPHRPQHSGDLVRERATWALAQVRGGRVVQPLVSALHDADWRVRAYAAWSLGVAGERQTTVPLVEALNDPVWRVRAQAAASLAALPDSIAITPLITLAHDATWQVRASVAEALKAIGGASVEATLREQATDPHIAVRSVAELARP